MTSTYILDASFISSLGALDNFCKTLQFRPPLTTEQMPMQGIKYLADKGVSFILPNEVLRELYHQPYNVLDPRDSYAKHTKQGMGLDENGPFFDPNKLRLDTRNLEHSQAGFLPILRELYSEGRLVCFETPEKYAEAAKTNKLEGKIAIVAGYPLEKGDGLQVYHNPLLKPGETKEQPGDKEIMRIWHQIRPDDMFHAPYALLTIDKGLREQFYPDGKPHANEMVFGVYGFADILGKLGFTPMARTLTTAATMYDQERAKDPEAMRSIGFPVSETAKLMIDKFIEYSGIPVREPTVVVKR